MSAQPKYILTERIAQGGMAEIHLGKSIGSDGFARACAFKRILPHFASDAEFIQMFRNEAMVAKQLQNKNIVQVFDFVGDGQSFMLVMEFVDGQDLRAVLGASAQAKKRIPVEIAVYIAIEALSGLAFAHGATDMAGKSMGIIHRDVSPQNILVSYEGDIKITDFGIAKVQNSGSNTRAGVLKGKFSYMSPEQASGLAVDIRSDLFALGVVIYEMLTMTRLFKGEDLAILQAVRTCKIKPPNQVRETSIPAELETIVMKMLSADPAKRYQTGRDAIKDLSKFLYSYRPDFFGGEVAEFMQKIFVEKMESAKLRLRSTLALPDSALALGALRDAVVIDGNGVRMSHPGQAVDGGMGRNVTNPPASSPSRRSPMSSEDRQLPPLEIMNARERTNIEGSYNNVRNAVGNGVGNGQTRSGNQGGITRAGHKNKPSSVRKKKGMGLEVFLLLGALLFCIGVGGFVVGTKLKLFSFQTELEVITRPGGKAQIQVDGQLLFQGAYQNIPIKIKLDGAAQRQIIVTKPGFLPEQLTLMPSALGGRRREVIVLKKDGVHGQMRFVSNHPGASISVADGFDGGALPYTFEFLVVGKTYDFKVTHPKCASQIFRETVSPAAERQLVLRQITLKNCK